MIAIISPAKNMRTAKSIAPTGKPQFLTETLTLVKQLQTISPWQLESYMKINPQLALDAAGYFGQFSADAPGTPALLAYHGLQYQNIAAETFSADDLDFAQDHLRIISGLYGLLRPLDGILPYRLEMQCKLPFLPQRSLYEFWGDKLYRSLFSSKQPVLNLASKEYAKAILPHITSCDIWIDCDFLVARHGKLRTLATSAKMARGQMVQYIVKNHLTNPEQVQSFCWDGYHFFRERSTASHYIFIQEG